MQIVYYYSMKLKKQLTTIDVFSIATGAMISSGLFVLPAIAFRKAGTGIIIAYALAGVMMIPALFSQLELATALPKAGGTYFYSDRILGTAAGVVNGFGNWFSISLKSAFALVGIGAFATLLFPDLQEWQIKGIASTACIIFTILNLFSVKSSSKAQIVMVVFLLFILGQFVVIGYRRADFSLFQSGIDTNWLQIISTTGMVFISYGGLTKTASIAEEVKNPRQHLVRGTLLAFVVVQGLYLLVILVILGIMPGDDMGASLTPVSDTASRLFLNARLSGIEMAITAIAAMLAFITTANAGIMTASRVPLAMSRDGLIPDMLAKMSPRSKTPWVSILFTSAFMLFVIIVLNIEDLAKVASMVMLILFTMVNISVLVVRVSKISNYKPTFKAPLFPFLQVAGIAVYLFLIVAMDWKVLLMTVGFILVAVAWYFLFAKRRVARKSALVHMIENITAPELIDNEKMLESELLNILMERDEIVEDRFDSIVRNSIVVDIDHTVTRDEMFSEVAERASDRLGVSRDSLMTKLIKREEDAPTLIYPGVAVPHAIPHVIIEGSHAFDIVLIRDKFGIKWNDDGEIVYTAFCLIGTSDERNFHLQALAAIAQLLMDPAFHDEWMNARNAKEMRSVILLSKRRRQQAN
jgi:APA family basic amino acid/polyamine antiporter